MLSMVMKADFFLDFGDSNASTPNARRYASDDCSSSVKGSNAHVQRGYWTESYFKVKQVNLPSFAARTFLPEVWAAYCGVVSSAENADDLLSSGGIELHEIKAWQFIRFRQLGSFTEHVIRAPRGLCNYTSVDCGDGS